MRVMVGAVRRAVERCLVLKAIGDLKKELEEET
jgi:hypothetical protein